VIEYFIYLLLILKWKKLSIGYAAYSFKTYGNKLLYFNSVVALFLFRLKLKVDFKECVNYAVQNNISIKGRRY
jgi:hypothetical protein